MDLRQMGVQRAATMLVAGALGLGLSVGLAGCNGSDAIVTQTPTPTPTPADSPSGGASVTSSPSASASVAASPGASPGASDTASADASTDANPAPLSDEELLKILPEYADRTDLQGAVVTAEFFIQEFPRMMSSGDTDVWDSLSLPGCDFCADGHKRALANRESETSFRGGEVTQGQSITEAVLRDDDGVEVTYPVHISQIFSAESGAEESLAVEAKDGRFLMLLERRGDVWRISAVASESAHE